MTCARWASARTWSPSTATRRRSTSGASHHLQTWAAFLLGYDHDTPRSIRATCDWAIQQRFTFAAYNVLMPYPGTALYERPLGMWGFLKWLSLAAGATAMVIAIITVPIYVNARRFGDVSQPGWSLGRWGDPVLLVAALVASILMAVGAIIAL